MELIQFIKLVPGISKFWPNSLKIRFWNFYQIMKLRGWNPYAWVFHSKNHSICWSYYGCHFYIWNKRWFYDFIYAHAILNPVIFDFWSFFIKKDICSVNFVYVSSRRFRIFKKSIINKIKSYWWNWIKLEIHGHYYGYFIVTTLVL